MRVAAATKLPWWHVAGDGPPALGAYPPAWKPYGLEAGSERDRLIGTKS